MTFKVYKDQDANAVFIENANGVQFLNALQATMDDPSDVVVNVQDLSKNVEIFSGIPFADFVDQSGTPYGATALEVCNALNAEFSSAGGADGVAPTITSATTVNMTQGDTLNYELVATNGVGYEWSNLPSGVVNVEGNVRKLIGGSTLTAGTYNITAKAINYFGEDSETIALTVAAPAFSNTKSIRGDNLDYLSADSDDVQGVFKRSGNGSGASDAWSVAFWIKPSSHTNNQQTVFYYGGNDLNNEGYIWARYLGSSSFRSIQFTYGTNNNRLRLLTPQNTFSVNQWHHVLITYDGGTTGSASGSVSSYYSRFKIFVDGVQQTTSNNHNNFGFSGDINSELFSIAKKGPTTGYMRGGPKLDELALWPSDQSGNISDIYNSGSTHDLDQLDTPPNHWWRMGDGDTYPNIQDNVGTATFVMYNMTAADIVTDAP